MKVAKRDTLEELKPGDWSKFADETGLALRFISTRAKELAGAVSESISETKSEILDSASYRIAAEKISSVISARANSLCQRVS